MVSQAIPQVGEPAPDFTAVDQAGKPVKLSDYQGKWIVLYFYPRDNTSGCTKEACSLRDSAPVLADANAVVLGVSTDTPESHRNFIEKFNLPFTLIADTDAAVSTQYGVYVEKERDGKKSMGIMRTTFIIDPEGVIRKVFTKVDVEKHGEEVLAAIKH